MSVAQNFTTRWSQLQGKQRVAAIILILCLITGIGLASYFLFVPRYVPLFTGLNPQQANEISESMRQENIPFRLGSGGSSILVPQKEMHEIRIRMAGEGFYNNGIGFELFDQMNLGLTDFERRLNLQRALQEELRRTIVQYHEIETARVHLVIPEPTLFQRDSRPSTASVAVKLRPMSSLGPEQVKSLVYLVSMSVPDLKPENVTIIDVAGNVLSDSFVTDPQSTLGLTTSQMEMKRSFEKEVEQKLLSMMERVFGPGRVVAMVSADLNFDQQTVTKMVYDSDNSVLRSEHVVRERVTTPEGQGDTPGVDGNIPTYPEEVNDQGESVYERDEYTRNWEIDSSQTTTVYAPGRVERLSASVTVDADLTPEQLVTVEQMVAGAIGLETDRGDLLMVTGMPFNTDHLDGAIDDFALIEQREMMRQYMTYGLWGLGIILGFILLLVIVRKIFDLLTPAPAPAPSMLQHLPRPQPAANSGLPEVAASTEYQKPADTEIDKVRELINNHPREAAEVIKAWAYES